MNWTTEQQAVIDAANSAAASGYQGVYLCGVVGSGKTAIASALCKGPQFDCASIGVEARGAMNGDRDCRGESDMLYQARKAKTVLIDDWGRERSTDFEQQLVFMVFNAALNAGAFVFATSNRSKGGLVKHYGGDQGLESRLKLLKTIEFGRDMPDFREIE